MPSQTLLDWQSARLPRLADIDGQCAAAFAGAVPNSGLADESLRGYVMLLSAHLQGFCRDLHTECVQIVAATAPPALRRMIQSFGTAARDLDGANPKFESIRRDSDRFDMDLYAELTRRPAGAANALRVTHLGHLNLWRNYAAHRKATPPAHGGPFGLQTVRAWRDSCAGLALELDAVMYNQLQALTGIAPR